VKTKAHMPLLKMAERTHEAEEKRNRGEATTTIDRSETGVVLEKTTNAMDARR